MTNPTGLLTDEQLYVVPDVIAKSLSTLIDKIDCRKMRNIPALVVWVHSPNEHFIKLKIDESCSIIY
jgi:hypothetical protein